MDGCISRVKVTALIDNTTHYEGPILAENGISLLVEVEGRNLKSRILFDTGLTGRSLINNSDVLGVNLSKLDAIVISHNHYDHTGGLLEVLKRIDKPLPVIMHPDIFKPKYAILPSLGIKKLTYTGPSFKREDLERNGGLIVPSRSPVSIVEGVTTTGEIERVTEFERVEGFYVVENGMFREDHLPDDQALVIEMCDGGIVVLAGCSHSGVVNTVLHSLKVTGMNCVNALIGGFHLIDASDLKIEKTISELKKIKLKMIAPMHCTGFRAKKKISEAFPERFKEIYCGGFIEVRAEGF